MALILHLNVTAISSTAFLGTSVKFQLEVCLEKTWLLGLLTKLTSIKGFNPVMGKHFKIKFKSFSDVFFFPTM